MKQTIFFDRYCIRTAADGAPEEVSRTGAATNYKAIDTQSGERVELQLLPLATINPVELKQFELRARAVQKLEHVNISRVLAVGVQREYLALVSEYLRGETADSWVVARGPMSPDAVLRIGIQVLRALASGAFYGLSHRAIQPSNIMLLHAEAPDGGWPLIKLLNFGVAAAELHKQAANEELSPALGPQFASPEQLLNDKIDFRSEMYSLGATMSFLLTGRVPLPANRAAIYGGIRTAPDLRQLPRPLARLLVRMLHENPEKRPQDPVALEAEMQKCIAKLERHVGFRRSFLMPASSPQAAAVRWRSPKKALLRGAFAGATLVAIAAISSAFLLPRVAAMWQHEPSPKFIGVPVGVSRPQPIQTAPAVATQSVTPEPAPSVAPTPSPAIARKTETGESAQNEENSGLTSVARAKPTSRYSDHRESETGPDESSFGSSEPVTMERRPARTRSYSVSDEHNENDRPIARALPVGREEADFAADTSGDTHPRFIGLSADGRAVLRLPSGEIVSVSRRVKSDPRTRHFPRAEPVESNIDNPPASDSDPDD